jgi:hypothetical protein
VLDGAGNVGIGTSAPAFQLHVTTNSAAKPTSNAWTVISDARLKKNVRNYEAGLADLLQIRPVWFTYTGEAGMPQQEGVGVLAQELQQVAPYMVSEWTYRPESGPTPAEQGMEGQHGSAGTQYLGVDNGAMTYMTINAIKELNDKIEALKAVVAEQQKTIEALKSR